MQKFELSLEKDYVRSWDLKDGIREIFQNAYDAETELNHTFSYTYDGNTLRIFSRGAKLTTRTLLLGGTNKLQNSTTIGQFGEGYKIAALVLLRHGKEMTIYNPLAKQVWSPRIVKSRKYGAEILTFFVDTLPRDFAKNFPELNDSLVFEINGINQTEFDEMLKPANIRLMAGYTIIAKGDAGDILEIPDSPGNVFVGDLWVCTFGEYHYSYNFKPGQLKLDRDRKLASDFDLKWLSSSIWRSVSIDKNSHLAEIVYDLLMNMAGDTEFMRDCDSLGKTFSRQMYLRFVKEHGNDAIPVQSLAHADSIVTDKTKVEVSQKLFYAISQYFNYEYIPYVSIYSKLRDWLGTYRDQLTDEAAEELEAIINE